MSSELREDIENAIDTVSQATPTHQVVNIKTGQVVGTYSSLKRARNVLDKKDNEYGGYTHKIIPVAAPKSGAG